jgi:hypothetical protein
MAYSRMASSRQYGREDGFAWRHYRASPGEPVSARTDWDRQRDPNVGNGNFLLLG